MATDSDTKLTKYTSAITVVTADAMNKVYGGEYGSNSSVDEFHPLVGGHIHDGAHVDGHASKVLLTEGAHIRGVLNHQNLGGFGSTTPAVQFVNIQSYSDIIYGSPAERRAAALLAAEDLVNLSIPEFIENSTTGEKKYYLDLSQSAGGSDKNVQFNNSGAFGGDDGFVYDYDESRVGIGAVSPQRALHIVDNTNPPLRIEGVQAGTGGTPLGISASGDVYKDSNIGSQNLFATIAVATDGGSSSGGPIVADIAADTATLSAGTGIILTAVADTDTIKIESSVTPGSTYTADGEGIELSGTEFGLELDGTTLKKSASGLKLDRSWEWLNPFRWIPHAPTAPELRDILTASGAAGFSARVIAYDGTTDEYASLVVEVPRDSSGALPVSVRGTIYVMGSGIPEGTADAVMYLHYGVIGGNVDVVSDAETFGGTWGLEEFHKFIIADGSSVQNFEYASQTLEGGVSGNGLIHIKLSRLANTDAADNNPDDLLVLGLGLSWTW